MPVAHPARSAWEPLLTGPRAEPFRSALDDLLSELRRPERRQEMPAGLSHGKAGAALLFAQLDLESPDQELQDLSELFLAEALEALETGAMGPELFQGFPGIAWTAQRIWKPAVEEGQEDPLEEIDQALLDRLGRDHWGGEYDLVNGLVGLGVYGLERQTILSGRRIVERVIQHLDTSRISTPFGTTWLTPAERLIPEMRELYPTGTFNLGLAHGIPCVIAFLARALEAEIARETATTLLEGAVSWLLGQKLPLGLVSNYGSLLPPDVPTRDNWSRVAWCYGDLGISLALLSAAQAAGRPEWEVEAITTAEKAWLRPMSSTGANSAFVCHGAAGNAHLFNRLYQATRRPLFREAALGWFEKTLSWRSDEQGIAGFGYSHLDTDGAPNLNGLLEGGTGISLVLLAGLGRTPPDWDRLLLVDLPPIP